MEKAASEAAAAAIWSSCLEDRRTLVMQGTLSLETKPIPYVSQHESKDQRDEDLLALNSPSISSSPTCVLSEECTEELDISRVCLRECGYCAI